MDQSIQNNAKEKGRKKIDIALYSIFMDVRFVLNHKVWHEQSYWSVKTRAARSSFLSDRQVFDRDDRNTSYIRNGKTFRQIL